MHITLEQARALDALARTGTFAAAARALHKGHTAILYALDTLEAQTELVLLDRSGYRTRLTAAGQRVREECQKLLAAEAALYAACAEMKSGWEPSLTVVFDGVFPAARILGAIGLLSAAHAPTRLHASVEFLAGVEETFFARGADLMLTVLTVKAPGLRAIRLPKLVARLVAHRRHPLVKQAARLGRPLGTDELEAHVFITVRGSDPRLELPTAQLDQRATVHLNDFVAKKAAILQGIGFGWLPEHLIAAELRRGTLVELPFGSGAHTFQPRLYHRDGERLGRAASRLVEALVAG